MRACIASTRLVWLLVCIFLLSGSFLPNKGGGILTSCWCYQDAWDACWWGQATSTLHQPNIRQLKHQTLYIHTNLHRKLKLNVYNLIVNTNPNVQNLSHPHQSLAKKYRLRSVWVYVATYVWCLNCLLSFLCCELCGFDPDIAIYILWQILMYILCV